MRFTGVRLPYWFSLYTFSSIFVLAFAGPVLADSNKSPHGSPHGKHSYSDKHHGGHGSGHMESNAYSDKHHSKSSQGNRNSHHGKMSGHGGHHSKNQIYGTGHGTRNFGHPGTHQGATEFINHILKFKEGMSLTAEQEQKLHSIRIEYKKNRIKMKATVQLANIDLHELLRNDNTSLSEIESNLKNVHALKADIYMASIKAKRDAKSVLSVEQQTRMDKIHERIKTHGGNMTHAGGYSRGGKGKTSY